jgi:predicted HD phosphohydrolase
VAQLALRVDDIERVLAEGADRLVEVGDGSGHSLAQTHLQHALQTAALVRLAAPDDDELAVAGLVHDIGHLLDGVVDETHAEGGAAAVREALGERVAGLVGLHVEAKRYLASSSGGYVLGADSVSSMTRQGGPMSSGERAAFERLALARDAVVLRRADDAGKVTGLVVDGLGDWTPILRRVAGRVG